MPFLWGALRRSCGGDSIRAEAGAAVTDCELNREVDPYYSRRYEESLEECRRTLEMEPTAHVAIFVRAAVYAALGRWEESIAGFEEAAKLTQGRAFWHALTDYAYAGSGNRKQAGGVIENLKQRSAAGQEYVDPILLAWIYTGLGEADLAFEWFDHAYEEGSCELLLTNVLPALDPIRSDPRMTKLVARIGLPPLGGATGLARHTDSLGNV